jgi:cytohesin
VALLLDKGADPNSRTANGSTLLHDAALKGHTKVVELLLERGADPKRLNAEGATPLHDAALAGHTESIALLLAKGAPIDARETGSGATALHHAASWGRLEAVALLLERGADRVTKNNAGLSAVAAAKANGHDRVARLLEEPSR